MRSNDRASTSGIHQGQRLDPQTKPEYMAAIFIYFCQNRVKAIAVPGVSIYGKAVLLGISKRGDTYLRTLLIHGARAVIRHAQNKPGYADSWLGKLIARRGKNVAAVALANKNVRIAWALLSKESKFRPDYASVQPTAA